MFMHGCDGCTHVLGCLLGNMHTNTHTGSQSQVISQSASGSLDIIILQEFFYKYMRLCFE